MANPYRHGKLPSGRGMQRRFYNVFTPRSKWWSDNRLYYGWTSRFRWRHVITRAPQEWTEGGKRRR